MTCVVAPSLSEPLFLGRDLLCQWNLVIDWITESLLLSGAGTPWIPRGDGEEEDPHWEASVLGLEEMTPSAFRKWLRVSLRQPESEVPAGTSGGSPQPTTSAQAPPPRTTSQDSGSGAGSLPPRRSTRLQQRGAAP